MQKRSKKSWSKLAARITLGLLVAGSTLGWAQGASAEVETKFKVTGWTDGKPVCDTSASGFGQIKYEIKNYEPMLYGKMDWALSNPTDPIFEVYYASTGGDPLKYIDLGKAVLCGSYAKDAAFSANNSKVVVTAGKLASVIGANMIGTGKAEGNIVEISGTAAIADSIGGAVSNGEANNNKVKIDNVNLDTELVCGASLRNDKGSATKNEVEIIGGNVKIEEISGAYAFPVNYANVSRNSVTVKNAVLGAYSRGSSNKIEISGASTASSREDGSYTGKAEYNSVVLENVKVGEDSYLSIYGGFGGESVIYNHVTIKDSEIVSDGNSDIIGGFTYGGDVKYNTVTIENSKVKGNVYAATAGAYGVKDVKASAIGNQIILKGTLDLKEAILYGVDKAELAKGHNSNALILDNLTGSNNSTEIKAVKNFNYIQFNTVNLTSDNNKDHAYLKLSDVKSEFLDEKTYLYGSISGTGYLMTGYFDGSKLDVSDLKNKFLGGSSVQDYLTGNGVKLTGYDVKVGYESLNYNNYVKVENGTSPIALAGVYTDGSGIEHTNTGASTSRAINITSAPASTVKIIAGAYNAAVDSASAKAVNGKVTISNVKLDNSSNQSDKKIKLYGGYSINGGAENNQLIINNLSYNANNSLRFYGNYATKGDIKSEITAVEVSGGKVYDIYGNYSNMGGNIIGMENVPVVKLTNVTSCGSITGARIQTSDNSNIYKIENNEVLIQYDGSNSGTGAGSVIGTEGFSNYIAKKNKVTIDGKFTVNSIMGVQQSKEAYGNTVTVRNGAVVNNKVYGVYLGEESASNNKVIIDNATVKELVEGASANVKATGNTVEITNGSKVGSVNGFVTGDAENNSTSIMGSSVTGEVVGHYYKALATEKNDLSGKQNTIEISNSDVDGNVVGSMILSSDYGSLMSSMQGQGASTLAGTLTENSVTISGNSEVKNATDRYVAGAYINKEYTGVVSGDVKNNTVTIKDGAKVATTIYGGYTVKGNAQNNSVTVQDNAQVTGSIYGNYSMDGNATGDGEHANVSISGGAKFSNTYGGYSKNGQANSNIVQITGEGTTYTGSWGIFGGYSEKEGGEANSNKVVVNGGAYISNVWGGDASVASGNIVIIGTAGDTTTVVNGDIRGAGGINLSKNEVKLLGGSINRIWGAFGTIVSENTVTISGGATRGEYSDGYIIGGEAESFSGDTDNIASNNVVNISAGNFNANVAGNVASSGSGIAKGDGIRANVSISGGTVNGNVYGGAGEIAEKNIVSISGGTVTGKYAGVIGGSGTTVSGNKISISGGTVNSKVTGGIGNNYFKYTYELNVDAIINSTVSGNVVEISGGTLGGEQKADIYAGYSESVISYKKEAVAKGNIKNNKIVITKGENLDVATSLVNANLYGSNLAASETSGNTLELKDASLSGLKINSINNFNNIIFGNVDLNSTTESNGYIKLVNAANLNYATITADVVKVGNTGEGYLITGNFSAKDVKFGGALASGKGEIVTDVESGGVKVGTGGGISVKVKEKDSEIPSQDNYIKVKFSGQDTVWSIMAGKYTNAEGKAYENGALNLSGIAKDGITYAGAYARTGKASGGTVKLTGNFNGTVYGGYSENNGGTENNTLEIDGSKSVTVNKIEAVDIIHVTGEVGKNTANAALNITNKADFTKANVNIEGLALTDANNGDVYKVISNASVDAAKVVIKNLAKVDGNVVKANIITKDVQDDKLTLTYGGKVVTGSYTDEAGTVATKDGVLKVSDIGALEEGVIYTGAYSANGTANGTVDLDNSFAGTLYGYYQANGENGSGTLNVRGKDLVVKEIANFNTINFFVPADMPKDGTVLKVESEVNIAGAKVNAGINNKSALDVGDEITLLEAVSLDATGIVAGKVTENDFIDYDMNIESLNNQLKAKITSKGISNENSKSPVETIAGSLVMLNMGAEQLAGKGFESAAEAIASEKATAPNCMTPFASISGNKVKAETGSHIDIKGWNLNLGFAKEIDNKSGKLLIAPLVEYGRGTYDSYVENNIGVVHADGTSKYWGAGMMARQTNENGFYYEGSLVGGKSTNDYSTKDIGSGISYETSAMYITAHLGAGKIVEVTDKDKLNFYGKFFYSRLGSDDTTLSNGAKYSFDTSESKRMRLGGRLTRELNEKNKLYAGMAWQYEFDAESRATVNGKTAQAPTMKGHTGILELGWKVKPGNSKFDVDLSFLGYTGKHKGGSINVNMNWNF